jgi:hypothetical protein
MKSQMNNWRKFITLEEQRKNQGVINFYKTPPDPEYITEVLGIKVPLNESYTEYSQALVEEIVREQILFEGFWDSVKNMADKATKPIRDLWKSIKLIMSNGYYLKKFRKQLNKYRRNIQTNFNNFMRKISARVPALDNTVQTIGRMINSAFDKVEGLSGWKAGLATMGLIAAFTFIQEKFGDLLKDKVGEDEDVKAGVETLSNFMVNSMGLDSIANKLSSSLTDVKSYLGFLGPIVGGVNMVAKSLAGVTRPFVEKYVEETAVDFSGA